MTAERTMSRLDAKTEDTLRALEESLWRAKTRYDDALMAQTFAEDFIEFGRSGRVYTRAEMLLGQEYGPDAEIHATLPLRDFQARRLGQDIAQVTYISEVRYGADVLVGNRSSIWRYEGGRWRLCFHQGTPVV